MGSGRNADDSPYDPVAKRVAEFVGRQVGGHPGTDADSERFQSRLAEFRQTRRSRKWFVVGVASALTISLAGLIGSRRPDRRPTEELSYTVDGSGPAPGGYVPVSKTAESLIAFSDGSKVSMSAGTRGRVVELNGRGARFALEAGRAAVDVVHRPQTNWRIEAGPFVVVVHGTSFTVAWNPAEAIFELRLQSGAVSVVGPLAEREVHLRQGQTLRVNVSDGTSTIGETGRIPPAAVDPASPSTDRSPGTGAIPPSSPSTRAWPQAGPAARGARPSWTHQNWTASLAKGNAAAIVADADRRGLPAVLDQAASEDLWALANAARYTGRYAVARQALTAQRLRFPASERAREAAFFLGRLDDASPGGGEGALGWYDRYLAEAPHGGHASDALGRRMTVLERSNRRDEALEVAHEYLRRFPQGIYANAARALTRARQ
jgi:TolA-binding protein